MQKTFNIEWTKNFFHLRCDGFSTLKLNALLHYLIFIHSISKAHIEVGTTIVKNL